MVRLLLDLGADATRRNKADEAILHLWIRSPDPDILRWLVEAGADLEAVCGVGKTPLQEAVSSHVYSSSTWEQVLPEQFREQLRLVREQAEKLAPGRRDPGKFLRAVEHLAASGADLNAPGRFETAPYLVALEAGDEEMVQLLRRLGAQEG